MSSSTPFSNKPNAHFHQPLMPQCMVSMNEREILNMVRNKSATTRAELVLATGLTAQSVMRLVDDLILRGMLKFGPSIVSGRGKPSPKVELIATFAYAFGISIATDSIALALIDFSGATLAQKQATVSPITRQVLIPLLRKMMDEMTQDCAIDASRLFGIGVGISGFFVGKNAQINPPDPLADLALLELDALFAKEFNQPVWLDNDGNVAAIGESLLGAGRWAKSFAYLYFAHGFGGGLVLDGRCIRGAYGNAGEFAGMLPMQGYARATLELLREMLIEDGVHFSTIQALINGFNPQWPAIDRWISRVAPGLSLIASAIMAIFDPDAIVLGGRIPKPLAERLISHIIIDNVSRRGLQRPEPKIVIAEAPIDAAAIGAATLPFKECFFR